MAKFSNPLGSGKQVWISQTYHGSSNRAVDIGSVSVGQGVYAIANGVITVATSSENGYCKLDIDNSNINVFYVHTYKWVKAGTRVKAGDKICEIAPESANGGVPVHLHLGLTPMDEYIMNYFDRTITFRTKYSDIKASWFKSDGTLNWTKFKDLSYLPEPEVCKDCIEKDKQISELNSKVSELQTSIKSRDAKIIDLKSQLEAQEKIHGGEIIKWEDKYRKLQEDMMRINTEKGEIQLELDTLKQSRFWWLAKWLDNIIPKKNE